ncbi:FAD/NAD-P-binding domain-containing protein [Trametes meyenii]|nr:FAD/NAD-P-binding domain-containing protein [Trametes meyenii]
MPGGWFSRKSTAHKASASPHRPPFILGDFSIDEYKPIKVIVIGAGFCGILAGIRHKIPNIDLTIYEKSAGIGGTWQNNNYPGLACDVPAHNYQFSFEQKKDWTTFYPSGTEVRQHLQDVVDKHKLMRYIRLRHEVVHAQYDAPAGKWCVRVRHPLAVDGAREDQVEGFEEVEDSADVLITAVGALSRWTWPDIPGLHDFQGALHHSAGFEPQPTRWEDVVEMWADKNVAVIGVGSSAIQIVPALQKRVKKLVHYVRGKTWLAAPLGTGLIRSLIGRDPADDGNYKFTPEEIERFKNEPGFFENFRLALENQFNSTFSWTIRGSPLQLQFQADCRKLMQDKLAKKPWIAEKLMPDFPVSCRRLTPGPGYLEALCEDNVEFVPSSIKRVTKNGIETVDGQYRDVDVIVCATGYDTSFQLPFKIVGRDGVDLNERWRPHPVSYLSVALDGFPNMFMALGPNSVLASGTLLPLMESQVGYAVQAVAKLQRDRLKSMEVRPEAVRDFDEYLEAYFPKTVFTEKCRSWYKMGKEEGRVVGLWPGSTLQGMKALAHPRWEDYKYELEDRVQNRFHFLGDGQTYSEKTLTGDRAWYLHEPYLDVPPLPID